MVGVPSGIIDQFLHPPVGALTNKLDGNGPYGPGSHTITSWDDSGTTRAVGNTFGCLAIAYGTIPLEWGYTLGWEDPISLAGGIHYEGRLLQVVVQHQLLLGLGGWVDTQIWDLDRAFNLLLWEHAFPGRIGLYVAPGWSFDLQFLMAL